MRRSWNCSCSTGISVSFLVSSINGPCLGAFPLLHRIEPLPRSGKTRRARRVYHRTNDVRPMPRSGITIVRAQLWCGYAAHGLWLPLALELGVARRFMPGYSHYAATRRLVFKHHGAV